MVSLCAPRRVRRRVRIAVTVGVFLSATATPIVAGAQAASYPSHPIRMIVPFSPGGTSDTLARILGQKITEAWRQPVVIDTRPGASGIIGTELAARAAGDGHTLLHGNLSQFATNPFLYSKIP